MLSKFNVKIEHNVAGMDDVNEFEYIDNPVNVAILNNDEGNDPIIEFLPSFKPIIVHVYLK
jgi:hypothetical protein